MRIGGLTALGLSSPQLVRLRNARAERADLPVAPLTNSCVFIFLFGGPSHIDLWDMKPDAPAEIRGEFQSIATNVAGIRVCEHLPLLAQSMQKVCLLRSMTHRMNVHGPACSEIYSGRPYFGPPVTDQASPQDWPSLASLVMKFAASNTGFPPSIVLPTYSHFVGQSNRIAGQTGGRMGDQWDPLLIQGNPQRPDFEVPGLRLPDDVSIARLQSRRSLQQQFGAIYGAAQSRIASAKQLDDHFAAAMNLIEQSQTAAAFAIDRERLEVRHRYGFTKFGQSLLLARRVIEAGVPLVTVNWEDDSRFDKVSPQWDTHHKNFQKLKDGLCPVFDQAFSAFINDLDQRGLLQSTLVVALGEFGRSPQIGVVTQNNMTEKTGRDHWPHAFTALLAGGGVRGGQTYGSTTSTGGYVAEKPVTPADLCATILKHLGISATMKYEDHFQRNLQQLCEGRPVEGLL